MNQGNFSSSSEKDSFSPYPSLSPSPFLLPAPPSSTPPPPSASIPSSFYLFPSVALMPRWELLSGVVPPPSPRVSGAALEDSRVLKGRGGRRDSAPLPRRAGRLSEPRSESAGVTKERGASAREQKVPSGPRSWGMGPARGPGGWRRWSRTLRAAAGQSHQSAGRAARPATRSSLPEARAERGRLAAGLPPPPHRWAGGGGGSELFRASQPSVLPPPPGP